MPQRDSTKALHDEMAVIDAACAYLVRATAVAPGERISKVLRDLVAGEIPMHGAERLRKAAEGVRQQMANLWARGAAWVGGERAYEVLGAALQQADIDLILLQWVADTAAGRPAFRGLKAASPEGVVAWRVAVTVDQRTFVWDAPLELSGPREACLAADEARRLWAEGRDQALKAAPWREVARKPAAGGAHVDLGSACLPGELFLGGREAVPAPQWA